MPQKQCFLIVNQHTIGGEGACSYNGKPHIIILLISYLLYMNESWLEQKSLLKSCRRIKHSLHVFAFSCYPGGGDMVKSCAVLFCVNNMNVIWRSFRTIPLIYKLSRVLEVLLPRFPLLWSGELSCLCKIILPFFLSRCVVVILNPWKNTQRHIFNTSRYCSFSLP